MTIFTYLSDIIGAAPPGFAFLEYIFSFVLVCFVLFLVYKLFEALARLF